MILHYESELIYYSLHIILSYMKLQCFKTTDWVNATKHTGAFLVDSLSSNTNTNCWLVGLTMRRHPSDTIHLL